MFYIVRKGMPNPKLIWKSHGVENVPEGYINPKLSSSIHSVEIMPGHRSILNSGQNPMWL